MRLWTLAMIVVLGSGCFGSVRAGESVLPLLDAAKPPERIVAIVEGRLSEAERLLAVSLQGLSARSPVAVYIIAGGGYELWLSQLMRDGVPVERVQSLDRLLSAVEEAVAISGYVLTRAGHPSVNAATSLAALHQAVLIDERLEPLAQERGWPRLIDARELRDRDAWRMGEGAYAADVLFQQAPNKWHLRDAVIAAGGYVFYDPPPDLFREIISHADPNAPLLGWGEGHEDRHVGMATVGGLRTIPADWSANLSVFARFTAPPLRQNRSRVVETPYEPDVHYVSFIMSDGDNIQWLLGNNFAQAFNYFGSPFRGRFPFGWQFAPGLADLAPRQAAWFYQEARNDEFVMGVSGTGYFYPSQYPDAALDAHMRSLEAAISRTDMPIVTILDHAALGSNAFRRVAERYAAVPGLVGAVYLNYADYAAGRGQILWVDQTPFVAARFKLWDGNPLELAGRINAMPRTPTTSDGYSIVSVHPWSHALHDVWSVIGALDDHVRVVLPSELFARIRNHVER